MRGGFSIPKPIPLGKRLEDFLKAINDSLAPMLDALVNLLSGFADLVRVSTDSPSEVKHG